MYPEDQKFPRNDTIRCNHRIFVLGIRGPEQFRIHSSNWKPKNKAVMTNHWWNRTLRKQRINYPFFQSELRSAPFSIPYIPFRWESKNKTILETRKLLIRRSELRIAPFSILCIPFRWKSKNKTILKTHLPLVRQSELRFASLSILYIRSRWVPKCPRNDSRISSR